ncbi:hypothetical protein Tco_1390496 [Tanacetum coccineum]
MWLEEDPEEDHADYPTDGGDNDDDSSDDDDDGDRDEEEEKEEHLAPADSSVVPVIDPTPMLAATEALIAVVAVALPSSPPPYPLTPLSSPLPQIPLPPLLVPSLPSPLPSPPTHTSPLYTDVPLGYSAAEIRLRAASPPLLLPSTTHIDDIPEADMSLRNRARFTTPASGFEVGESSAAAAARQAGLDVATVDVTPRRQISREFGYGIEDVWDDMVRDIEERVSTTVKGLSQRVTDLSTTLALDTYEIYVLLEDAQEDRALQRARVNT